ncbi:WD40 repeat domain-containing protein [Phanerochaete sordida]|uniref:WD40 repeat domain-containing protein n=1 Tax=Phanerochaete sordida TaxID=48140 RepID=A0A9P3GR54_9APHY|nr:WD40 repeat domain-containing protein [Phanerochaete sordida]
MFEWFCGRRTPDKIYAKSLEFLNIGYPLWRPEPDESLGETHVCDVGFVREGKFFRLLNFDVSAAEKEVTCEGPSFEDIEPLPPHAIVFDRTKGIVSAGHYSSHSKDGDMARAAVGITPATGASAGIDAKYSFTGTQGAALTMQSAADFEGIVPSLFIKRYILRNHERWCTYARDVRHLDIKPKDIVVVSGCTKTAPDWSITVFGLSRKTTAGVSLGASAGPAAAEVRGSHTVSVTSSSIHRQGPGPPPGPTKSRRRTAVADVQKSHCVGIRRLKIRTRFLTMPKIVAGAGYHQLPGPGDESGNLSNAANATSLQEDPQGSLWGMVRESDHIPDLLDALLDYMLEVSGATSVAASDNDVEKILGGRHVLDFSSYLRHISKFTVQVTDGVGHIEIQDLVCDEQKAQFSTQFIKKADIRKWPNITLQAAGKLEDCQISYKPSRGTDTHFAKYKTVVFGDFNSMQINDADCVSISANGKLLAAAIGNTIAVWRLQDGLTVQRLERDGHTETIQQIAFSPDGQHVVLGADDRLALVWDVKTGDVVHRLEGHKATIYYAAFSPDGTRIATRSSDSELRMWSASSGELLYANTDLKSSSSDEILFSPDGSRLAAHSDTSSGHSAMAVLDCCTGERIAMLRKQEIYRMAFSPSGDRIVTGSRDGSACVWDATSGKALLELKEHMDEVNAVAFSPDGGEVATASEDGTVVTYDSRTGERRFKFRVESVPGEDMEVVYTVAYSPKNEFIACGASDGCVRVWNHKTGAFVATFQGHNTDVWRVMFTPDGWDVLSYGGDHVVRMWSVRDALRLS